MNILLGTRSGGRWGGDTTFSLVGEYLQSKLADYGPAISQIEIVACFSGIGNPKLAYLYEAFNSKVIPALPTIKFERKKSRITLCYLTLLTDAAYLETSTPLSLEMFSNAIRETAENLHLIDSRLKRGDQFDLARFHSDIAKAIAQIPTTDEQIYQVKDDLDDARFRRQFAMSPWEKLGIDWADYHSSARSLLNDPFFWDCADNDAPHGNDTGADLLAEFKRWNNRNPDRPAHEMALELLSSWGITQTSLAAVDENKVRELIADNEIAFQVTCNAAIAAAFAAVKVRGCCDPATRMAALMAIEQQQTAAKLRDINSAQSEGRLASLDLLASTLNRMPTIADEYATR